MNYRLVIVEPAEADVDDIYAYILARSPQGAASWYREFVACTERMSRHPLAYAVAPEDAEFHLQLRQALFKTRHGDFYHCVFTIVEDEVRILRVRGPGQAPLKASDIGTR